MAFFSRYNPPPSVPHKVVKGSSRTVQDFKNEADINVLVNRYSETGSFYDPLAVNRSRVPVFADVTYMPDDFLGAVKLVDDAKDRFSQLDSKIRDRFNNNPYLLLEFLQNKANLNEAIDLGLIEKPATPATSEPDYQPAPPAETKSA